MSTHPESSGKRWQANNNTRTIRKPTVDNRSPTMRQSPSMFVPIQSTEIRPPQIAQLFDGYQSRLVLQRKQEDEMFKNFSRLVKEVKANRKTQDEYLANLRRAMDIQDEENLESTQESEFQDVEAHEEHRMRSLSQHIVHTNADDGSQERESTAQHIDSMLDLLDQVEVDDGLDSVLGQESQVKETPTVQRTPPITPSTSGRSRSLLPPMTNIATLDMTRRAEEPTSPTQVERNRIEEEEWVMVSNVTPPSTASNPRKRKKRGVQTAAITMGPPPKRKTARFSEEKNRRYFEWIEMDPREQSQALREDSVNPFVTCNCGLSSCSNCRKRRG